MFTIKADMQFTCQDKHWPMMQTTFAAGAGHDHMTSDMVHLLDPSLLEARCGNAAGTEIGLDLAASVSCC